MPGENEIKHKITLEGEKEYKAALQDARRNLRTLKSELKAETAELGKNASEQQKAEVKAKSLKKQIAEQEKIVETCKQQLAEAKKEYGDNADVIAKYEIQLNNARTALANMRNDLTGVGQAMQTVTTETNTGVTAAKSFADAFGSIAGVAGGVSDAIEGIFTGMVGTIKDAITEVWADITELAGRANEWADLAGFWNTSTTNIQKWYRAVGSSHNDFATLNNAVTRIVMADSKKIAEAAGVSSESYTDQWEYAMAVLGNLAEMGYDDRLKALGEIFGEKRATGVMDLVNDWGTIVDNLNRFDAENGGIGMTEEQMSDMAKLAEDVDKIQQTWEAFKDSFMAGAFGKLSLDLVGSAQGMLDSLIGFMNSDSEAERDAYIEEFKQNATNFFRRLGEALTEAAKALGDVGNDLAGSEDGTVAAIGKVFQGLSSALDWFADGSHIDDVVRGFETLAGFWIAGKGAQMGAKILEIVGNISAIKMFSGAGAAGIAGASATAAAEAGAAAGTSWGAAFGAAVLKAVPWLAGLITLITPAETASNDWDTMVDETTGELTAAGKEAQEMERRRSAAGVFALETDDLAAREAAGRAALTPEQARAAEDFWDIYRSFKGDEADKQDVRDTMDTVEAAFAGQEDLMRQIVTWISTYGDNRDDSWMGIEDLPANFWQQLGGQNQGKDQLTGQDVRGMTNAVNGLGAAVEAGAAKGVSGIKVTLDGETVGRLVAPYVSAGIARNVALPW
jgi:hypothetical protein